MKVYRKESPFRLTSIANREAKYRCCYVSKAIFEVNHYDSKDMKLVIAPMRPCGFA